MESNWNNPKESRIMPGQEGQTGVYEKAQELAGQASEKAGEVYQKTSEAMSGAYEQGVSYVRENPAMMTLIALGIGVGVGLLLGAGMRRPRYSRFTTPIVDAVYDVISDYVR